MKFKFQIENHHFDFCTWVVQDLGVVPWSSFWLPWRLGGVTYSLTKMWALRWHNRDKWSKCALTLDGSIKYDVQLCVMNVFLQNSTSANANMKTVLKGLKLRLACTFIVQQSWFHKRWLHHLIPPKQLCHEHQVVILGKYSDKSKTQHWVIHK